MPSEHFTGEDGSRVNDLLRAAITGRLTLDSENAIIPEPDNLIENPYAIERADGEPVGYDLSGLPAEVVGYLVNVTPEGFPRKNRLMRQNTHVIATDENSWVQEEEIVPGHRTAATTTRKADLPTVLAVPATTRAYIPGRYGLAFGYSQKTQLLSNPKKPRKRPGGGKFPKAGRAEGNPNGDPTGRDRKRAKVGKEKTKGRGQTGKRTPTTGLRYFDLLTGQIPRVYLPDSHPVGATHIDLYLTKPGGNAAFLQVSLPLSEIGDYHDLPAPLRTTIRAQTQNTTGIEAPRPRKLGRDMQIKQVPGMRLMEGVYTPIPALRLGTGITEAARIGDSVTVRGDRELRQVGTEQVPVGSSAMFRDATRDATRDALAPGASFTRLTGTSGLSDREVREKVGHYVYEAMVARADDLRAGESVDSNDPEILTAASDAFDADHPEAASANASASAHATSERDRAYGKREGTRYAERGGEYLGEEIDTAESHLIRLMNEARDAEGLPPLVLNRNLTRTAYREAGGSRPTPEAEYPFGSWTEEFSSSDGSPENALAGLSDPEDLRSHMTAACVGVAREPHPDGGFVWVVAFGERVVTWDDVEEDDPGYLSCERIDPEGNTHRYVGESRFEVVEPDGTTYTDAEFVARADNIGPTLGYDCVTGTSAGYTYSGSYASSLDNGAQSWNGKSKITVNRGGHIRVSDGDLPGSVYGRCYSEPDNRIIGDSQKLATNGGVANEAMWRHEFGHALGLGHNEGDSCMQSAVNINITSVRTVDAATARHLWGDATGGTPTPDPEDPPTEPTEPEQEYEERPVFKLVNLGYRKNACLEMNIPDLMRGGANPALRSIPYVYREPIPGTSSPDTGIGGRTCYRLYPKNATPQSAFNNVGQFKAHVRWSGAPPEAMLPGDSVRSVQEEPPTENTTRVIPPDPTSIPDPPGISGKRRPAAGDYLVSINYLYEDGTVSVESDPVSVTIGSQQMISANFPRTVNLLANATFSQVNAEGIPTGWTPTNISNVATNHVDTSEAGILRIEATATTASVPSLSATRIPVASDTTLTVGGRIALERQTDGSARVNLLQYDSSGTHLATITCGSVASPFEVPFVRTVLPTDRHAECTHVEVRATLAVGTSGVNARAAFSYLRVLPYASDIRHYTPGEGEDADSFDGSPESAYPLYSYIATGEPPVPAGQPLEEPAPPELMLAFDSGTFPTGSYERNVNSATGGMVTTTPIHGTRSYRSQDTSNTVNRYRHVEYDLTTGGRASRSQVASRALYRFDLLPSMGSGAGRVAFHEMRHSSDLICYLNAYQNGRLAIVVKYANGSNEYTLSHGLSAGRLVDVEVIVRTGSSGGVTVSLGFDGNPRKIAFDASFNLSSRTVRYLRFGVSGASDVKVTHDLYMDQAVVTDGGDVPMRETPQTPPDYTPEPPDRPRISGSGSSTVYRTQTAPDRDGVTQNVPHIYAFVRPEDVVTAPVVLPLFATPVFVWPGLSYTFALFMRRAVFTDAAPGFRVRLTGDGLDDLVLSGEDVSGTLAAAMTTRSWHPTGVEDDYLTFSVPEPLADEESGAMLAYTECQIELVASAGVYVMQEPLLTRGALPTYSARAARRTLRCSTGGTLSAILDAKPPVFEAGVYGIGVHYTDFGVTREVPEPYPDGTIGGSVDVLYSTSQNRVAFTPPTPYENDVAYIGRGEDGLLDYQNVNTRTPGRYLKYDVEMISDGWARPRIIPGGIHLDTWSQSGQLLREDGTAFPGGAVVANLVDEDYPETTYEQLAGHVLRVRESEDIGRVGEIRIGVATEDARREISALTRTSDLLIEMPLAGGSATGRILRIRPGAAIEWAQSGYTDLVPDDSGTGRRVRRTYAVGTIGWAEVVSSGDIPAVISPPLALTGDES